MQAITSAAGLEATASTTSEPSESVVDAGLEQTSLEHQPKEPFGRDDDKMNNRCRSMGRWFDGCNWCTSKGGGVLCTKMNCNFERHGIAYFAIGASDAPTATPQELDEMASTARRLLQVPGRRLRLVGEVTSTERTSTDERVALGLARATTVRRLLVDRGVDANRIDAVERTARYPVSVVVLEADPRYPTREDLPHGSEAYQSFCRDGTSADY